MVPESALVRSHHAVHLPATAHTAESEFLDGGIVFATPFSNQLTTSNLGIEASTPIHMRGLRESTQVHTEVGGVFCCLLMAGRQLNYCHILKRYTFRLTKLMLSVLLR